MNELELENIARRRVQMKRGYVIHLALYLTVNAMLVLVWSFTGRGYPWFLWPLVGWGIGIIANTLVVVMELVAPEEEAIRREVHRLHR